MWQGVFTRIGEAAGDLLSAAERVQFATCIDPSAFGLSAIPVARHQRNAGDAPGIGIDAAALYQGDSGGTAQGGKRIRTSRLGSLMMIELQR